MRQRAITTVLVGPGAMLREGLTRVLTTAGFRIVASAARLDDVDLGSLPSDRPVLCVIDVGDRPNTAVDQIARFKDYHPAARIAVLADQYNLADVVSAFRVGANAYFERTVDCGPFIKALELVMLGETILPLAILRFVYEAQEDASIAPDIVQDAEELLRVGTEHIPQLSAREMCILRCLIEGASNKVIARKMKIAEATVKVHVKAILRKIRVHNRTQAAIWAINTGSITLSADAPPSAPNELEQPAPLQEVARALSAPQRSDVTDRPAHINSVKPSTVDGPARKVTPRAGD